MNQKIMALDAHIINQIAAGEVIEGPYSAVKELVENAIDAQATEIRVEIRHGGKSFISVTDNGIGIPGNEIETAFLPHTTSKLRQIEDLQQIHTLGFRGEALASIASVAQVEIMTREIGEAVGHRALFSNGKMQLLEEAGAPQGTQIQIRDLFHATPARLKFMKSDGAESSKITELLTKLALSRPDIAFQYINNNNIMLTTRRNVDILQTAMTIFPHETAQGLFLAPEQIFSQNDLHIEMKGLIGQPQATKGNRSYQLFFVNGRTVKNELLTQAFERAYEGSVMVNRYPVGILYLTIPPQILDVNVHPSKTTIKFQEPDWIVDSVTRFVRRALHVKSEIVKPVFRESRPETMTPVLRESGTEAKKPIFRESEPKSADPDGQKAAQTVQIEMGEMSKQAFSSVAFSQENSLTFSAPEPIVIEDDSVLVRETAVEPVYSSPETMSQKLFLENILKKRHYRLAGLVFKTYILLESDNSLYLIDQHAAHERVLYDRMHQDVLNASVNIQEILDGQILELTVSEMEWITDHLPLFRKLGFVLDPFGHQAVRLTGVPYHLGLPAHHRLLTDMMDELMAQEWEDSHLPMEKLIRTACRAAVKARDALSPDEVIALLDQMTVLSVPLTCPHGRPIVLHLRDYDLEKLFKRV